METYGIQILNEPRGIIGLKVQHALLILLPIKHVAKLVVKHGWGPFEAMESLQDRWAGRGHEGRP